MQYAVTLLGMEGIKAATRDASKKIVGTCSKCGGIVSVPIAIWKTQRTIPACEDCGALADETVKLPVIPMR